jgi:hypothetical protein
MFVGYFRLELSQKDDSDLMKSFFGHAVYEIKVFLFLIRFSKTVKALQALNNSFEKSARTHSLLLVFKHQPAEIPASSSRAQLAGS